MSLRLDSRSTEFPFFEHLTDFTAFARERVARTRGGIVSILGRPRSASCF